MKEIKVSTLAKAINEVKPISDYEVTIRIGVTGVDESDVENQLSHIIEQLDENSEITIEKVGKYV